MRVAFIFAVLAVMFANAASVSAAHQKDEIAGAKVGKRTSRRIRGLKKKPEKTDEEETLQKMCYYSEVVKTFVERVTLPLFFAQVLNLYLTECEAEETPMMRRRLETREVTEGVKKAESEMKMMLCSYSDVFRSFWTMRLCRRGPAQWGRNC